MNPNSGPSEPSEPSDPRLERYSRNLAGVVGCFVVAWVTTLLPLPWSLISGVAALVAIVLLIRMLIAGWSTDRRRMAVFTTAVGIPACIALALSAVFSALFYGPMKEYQDCVSTAVTQRAEDSCRSDLPGAVSTWVGLS